MKRIGMIKSFRLLDGGDKFAIIFAPLFLIAWLCVVGSVVYVAIHFITKYW